MKKLVAIASLLVLGGSLGVAALHAGSAPSFAGPRSYATGNSPASVAIGDLNGDGEPDIATPNFIANTVSVLLNRGDGSFQPKRDYRTGTEPESIAIGDLNGDGEPDIATPNFIANTVSVLLNRGDGSFQAKLDYGTGVGPSSVAIGDLNGDRKPDLAIANGDANSVSVLANKGDGSFQPKRDYRTGVSPLSVAIGDLNGDGKRDLVTANAGANTVSVLINRGDGSFQARRDYRTGLGADDEPAPTSVAIGDLNADHKPDLAAANAGGANTVSVLLNRGDGSFQPKRDYRTGTEPESIAIGDLNGDGKPDLATANVIAKTISVLVNRGNGSLQSRLDYRTRLPGEIAHGALAISDLNGDGKLDLVTENDVASIVSVLINTPGLCTVQDVKGKTLSAASRTIARANCRIGKIRRAYAKTVKRGRVISEKPKPGTVLPNRGKVNLLVSFGRRRSR